MFVDAGIVDRLVVGEGLLNSLGTYQVQIEPLADGVYNITTTYEDLAGNVSAPSTPLKVTIAKYVLNLPGGTSDPASGAVTVDLNNGTITGYPGVPGGTKKPLHRCVSTSG